MTEKIDFTRRRFLFSLAAVPVAAVAAKHFILPKFELAPPPPRLVTYADIITFGTGLQRLDGSYNNMHGFEGKTTRFVIGLTTPWVSGR